MVNVQILYIGGTNPDKGGCTCYWLNSLFVQLIVCYERDTHFLILVWDALSVTALRLS